MIRLPTEEAVQMLGLDGAENVPTGDLKGSARRHNRKRVVGVKA